MNDKLDIQRLKHEDKPHLKYDHVYAVVRVDAYHGNIPPEDAINVVKLRWSRESAEAEAARLKQQNNGASYHPTIARIERRSGEAEKDNDKLDFQRLEHEDKPDLEYDHVYAIVRIDAFYTVDVTPQDAITVVKVLWSEESAEAETARLNQVNSGKRTSYHMKMTRLERRSSEAANDIGAT